MQTTPILLITFNRPSHTRKVLEVIRAQQPEQLFVFQDGTRDGNENDIVKCAEVRQVVKDLVNWECELETYYSDVNLGCGPGPAAAITWFFEYVEHGIILEDDAVPNNDFFLYATELLDKYKENSEIMAIGSMNVDKQKWGDGSYYFSMMNRNLCAWATWKRAWQTFDLNLANVSRYELSSALRKYGCGILERAYWCDRLDEIHKDCQNNSSWDMQFFMSIWLQNKKGIIPNVNLSSNIGTIGEATHEMAVGNIIDNIPTQPILPLVHPSDDSVQEEADKQFHFMYFEPNKDKWSWYLKYYNVFNRFIKRKLGIKGALRKRN